MSKIKKIEKAAEMWALMSQKEPALHEWVQIETHPPHLARWTAQWLGNRWGGIGAERDFARRWRPIRVDLPDWKE